MAVRANTYNIISAAALVRLPKTVCRCGRRHRRHRSRVVKCLTWLFPVHVFIYCWCPSKDVIATSYTKKCDESCVYIVDLEIYNGEGGYIFSKTKKTKMILVHNSDYRFDNNVNHFYLYFKFMNFKTCSELFII